MYQVKISNPAKRGLKKLPKKIQSLILNKIDDLAFLPRPYGAKKLKNFNDAYRIRIRDYRVIYYIKDNLLIVEIIDIGHRKDIYSH